MNKNDFFPACFSCSSNFNRLHNSLGLDHKKFVFEISEAENIKPGGLSNLIGDMFFTWSFYIKLLSFFKIIH